MNIILLSGGSGKRLWPLSNDIRSKQFIKIFRNENGELESMVQRIYHQIKAVDPNATVTIATSKSQVSAIHNQLGNDVGISVEPCRRDTFAAIALATAYLRDVKGARADEAAVVCPVDPYVDLSYFECIHRLYETAKREDNSLVLMGIQPTYPSEKYGYIIPITDPDGGQAYTFTEKPSKEKAEEYISRGALWNGGVFAFQLNYVLNKSREILGTADYYELYANYEKLNKISFDYAVAEKEKDIRVIFYSGQWKDLGTWNTLTEAMDEPVIGNGRLGEQCDHVHIINELTVPVLAMGLKDVVISASPEGILVSDKHQSSYIKPYVDEIDQRIMFAEKSWGNYTVLDVEDESLTIKVELLPGHRMHYHSHAHRDETWTIVSGEGRAIIDDAEIAVKPGVMLRLPAGCRHTIIADKKMTLIEVQMGESIDVHDKVKYSLEERYGKHK